MDDASLREFQLANHQHSLGNLQGAKATCLSLLTRNPGLPSPLWLLATIETELGDLASVRHLVERLYTMTAKLRPSELVAVTRLFITTGYFERAFELISTIAQTATNREVMVAVGEQLMMLGKHQEAVDCLAFAAAQGSRGPMLSFLRSNASKFCGDFAKAVDFAEEAIRQQPMFAHAYLTVSELGPLSDSAYRIDRLRRALSPQVTPSATGPNRAAFLAAARAVMHYALFRELDRIDDVDAAWQQLHMGMDLKAAQSSYSAEQERLLFEHLAIPKDGTPGEHDRQDLEGPIPIFIVGLPRTGTTLLDRILGNHPDVTTCGELNELQLSLKHELGHFCPEFIDSICAARLADVDARRVGCAYLRAVRWRVGGSKFFVDKHQSNFMLSGLIARGIPDAKILHIQRNPMDSCFSNLKEPFAAHAYHYSYRQADVAAHYLNYMDLMQKLSSMHPGKILNVQYEELVANPESVVDQIVNFCGLASQSGLTDIWRNISPVASASSGQVRGPIRSSHIDAWKRYDRHLEPLKRALGVQ